MATYDRLKKKYDKLIRKTLEKNKSILIESFIEYYGEKYRNIIERRFDEITFIYYIDWDTINYVIDYYLPNAKNPDEFKAIQAFWKARNSRSIFHRKNKFDLPSNYIGSVGTQILDWNLVRNSVLECLKGSDAFNLLYSGKTKTDRLVIFQILTLDEVTIIHEINHAMTRDSLVFLEDEDTLVGAISKTGLSVDIVMENDGDEIIEELINDKASQEITKIFKRRGGDLSLFCHDALLEYFYEFNYYLVDEFYYAFKEFIKIARITDDKNALVDRVGKKNYEDLTHLVDTYFNDDLDEIKEHKNEALEAIRDIIDRMKNNSKSSHDYSREELEFLYEQLKQNGHKIKFLNKVDSAEKNISKIL